MKEKQIGGKRPGAGRKPSDNPKIPVTIFVPIKLVEKIGGKEELRKTIYDFIENPAKEPLELPADYIQVGSVGILGQDGVVKPLTFKKPSQRPKKAKKEPELKSEIEWQASTLESYDGPKISPHMDEPFPKIDRDAILKQIAAIRAEKCPEHRNTPIGKKSWQMEQNKRIWVLENQLNQSK